MSDSAFGPVRWAKAVPPMLRSDGRPDTTAHHVLLVLATFAKRDGSDARPSNVTLADECYMTERAVIDALARIESARLISKAADLNGTTVWRLHMEIARVGRTVLDERREKIRQRATERQRRYREKITQQADRNAVPQRDVTLSDGVTSTPPVTPCQSVTAAHVTPSDSVSHAVGERESRRGTALVTPSPPSHQQVSGGVTALELPLNCQVLNTPAPSALDRDAQFAEFWKPYPRKIAKQAARKAWNKAIKDGADPDAITAGAVRYGLERHGKDQSFTPYPAKWLNDGRWDDEPERHLRAVSGDGYRPYQNPEDQSVYDKDEL